MTAVVRARVGADRWALAPVAHRSPRGARDRRLGARSHASASMRSAARALSSEASSRRWRAPRPRWLRRGRTPRRRRGGR
jgi:hypothetical protein